MLTLGIILLVGASAAAIDTQFQLGIMDYIGFSAGSTVTGLTIANINLISLGQPADIPMNEGEEEMGGFGSVAYLGLRSNITAYPTEVTSHTSLENLCKLSGNYTFAAGRYFQELEFVPSSIKVISEPQGEHVGNHSFKITGEGHIAGAKEKQRGLARLLNNSYGVLILLRDDGSRIAYGSQNRPVRFKCTLDHGQNAADKTGLKIEFECDSFVPGYEYYGTIPLSGGTLPVTT